MTKERTTHTLLAVVVALLGLHLALRLSPPKATAQEPQVWPQPPVVEPTVIAGAVIAPDPGRLGHWLWRFWSDGQVDMNWALFEEHTPGTECNLLTQCGPVVVVVP